MRAIAFLVAALPLAAQQPPYTFGTTVAANSGFRGNIYPLHEGTRHLPNFGKLKPLGTIYTKSLFVPSRDFEEGFPGVTDRFEWFGIDYRGRFWVSQPGTYRFSLTSDDGSALYIDDNRVIRNDGQHPSEEKQGKVKLGAGVHRIRVSYFQGPRFYVALVLQVAGPSDDEFRVFHTDEFAPPADQAWDVEKKRR